MWIASRSPSGPEATDGLYAWDADTPTLIDAVPQVSALERHPRLPVVYGLGAVAGDGRLYAWSRADDGSWVRRAELPSGGEEPCALAVSPDATVLVVANYGGTLARFTLDDDGLPTAAEVLALTGSGPDPDRQTSAHPHHVAFVRRDLVVCDLGSDAVILYAWRRGLTEQRRWPTPPGTGPRHLAHLGAGRVVVSGELASTVLVGSLDDGAWSVAPSTTRTSPPGVRCYPSDVVAATDGRMAYVANRGHDTVASVLCTHSVELLGEADAGGAWPQRLVIDAGRVLAACRDSDAITALPLRGGVARDGVRVAEAYAPTWLES